MRAWRGRRWGRRWSCRDVWARWRRSCPNNPWPRPWAPPGGLRAWWSKRPSPSSARRAPGACLPRRGAPRHRPWPRWRGGMAAVHSGRARPVPPWAASGRGPGDDRCARWSGRSAATRRGRRGRTWSLGAPGVRRRRPCPHVCSHSCGGSGPLGLRPPGGAMCPVMQTGHRCAVALFPQCWRRCAIRPLGCVGGPATPPSRRLVVSSPHRQPARWPSWALHWKTE